MATLEKDIYNIRNLAAKGSVSTTDSPSELTVEHWFHYYRGVAINEYFIGDRYRIDPLLYQKTGCLELETFDMAECPCGEIQWGCDIKRVELPKVVDHHGLPLLNVFLVDGRTAIDLVPVDAVGFSQHARFTGDRTKSFVERSTNDGMMYLYVISNEEDFAYVKARGVFSEPPRVVTKEGTPGNCVDRCYDMTKDDYPMSEVIRAMVYKKIMERELQFTLATADDIINNNRMDKALLEVRQILTQLELYGKKANPGTASTTQGREMGVRK